MRELGQRPGSPAGGLWQPLQAQPQRGSVSRARREGKANTRPKPPPGLGGSRAGPWLRLPPRPQLPVLPSPSPAVRQPRSPKRSRGSAVAPPGFFRFSPILPGPASPAGPTGRGSRKRRALLRGALPALGTGAAPFAAAGLRKPGGGAPRGRFGGKRQIWSGSGQKGGREQEAHWGDQTSDTAQGALAAFQPPRAAGELKRLKEAGRAGEPAREQRLPK